jgi:hypothetical protein
VEQAGEIGSLILVTFEMPSTPPIGYVDIWDYSSGRELRMEIYISKLSVLTGMSLSGRWVLMERYEIWGRVQVQESSRLGSCSHWIRENPRE